MLRTIMGRLHDTEMWASYRPHIPWQIYLLTLLGVSVGTSSFWMWRHGQAGLAVIALIVGILLILPIIPVSALVRFMRRYRKILREQMLAPIAWRGDEKVLDVGCGSGLLLNGAALHLTTGKAIGIDIWAPMGGGGNVDLLWKNARAEKVADRIEFKKANALDLPFEDKMFNVVFSSGTVHHISHNSADHDRAVCEMIRVLKPGGQIVLWDVSDVMNASAERMKQAGLKCEVREAEKFLQFDTSIVIGKKTDGN